jgi:hypothetical protein
MNASHIEMIAGMEREGWSYLLWVGAEGGEWLAVVGDGGGDVGDKARLGEHVGEGLTAGGHEHLQRQGAEKRGGLVEVRGEERKRGNGGEEGLHECVHGWVGLCDHG